MPNFKAVLTRRWQQVTRSSWPTPIAELIKPFWPLQLPPLLLFVSPHQPLVSFTCPPKVRRPFAHVRPRFAGGGRLVPLLPRRRPPALGRRGDVEGAGEGAPPARDLPLGQRALI